MRNFAPLIMSELRKHAPKPAIAKQLIGAIHVKKREEYFFNKDLDSLIKSGEVVKTPKGFAIPKKKPGVEAVIVRVHEKFAFARPDGADSDVFIPGRYTLGAMPGDRVRVRIVGHDRGLPDGEVMEVLQRSDYTFSGRVIKNSRACLVKPDKDFMIEIPVRRGDHSFVKDGDKVTASIYKYGQRHFDHIATINNVFGSSQSAAACCEAILDSHNIYRDFPGEVLIQAEEISEKGIHPKEVLVRTDLRAENIFTIDGADSKDLDDAISIKKTDTGWHLGVHIADVSYYVPHNSPLDKEAFTRGTSVYFANSVVPMLPKELSNGICSLNPNEDRLTFSALMELDENGDFISYDFVKTIIRSKVKGVYSEVNEIIAGQAGAEVAEKYKYQLSEIALMYKLSAILNKKRMARGGINLDSTESKIILNEQGIAVDIKPRERGISECIIEEFMLKANEAAALFGQKYQLPFVFRVHEDPDPDRISNLRTMLLNLGIDTKDLAGEISSYSLAAVLKSVEGTKYHKMINTAILRSMSKAKYSSDNIGHFGLVLENYSHFTSPIRRYPDLMIHRFMSGKLLNMKKENIEKRYRDFATEGSLQSSNTEVNAMQVERMCEDCYKAEYIKNHIGEEFEGFVSGVASHGVYVELANTVEGMFKADLITEYDFIYNDNMQYKDTRSDRTISIGDGIRIKVVGADVSSGNIDFEFVEFFTVE